MISIDYQSRLPLYEQIVQRFQTLILKGAIQPDTQMPSVRALAVDLSINPNTIQKAYSLLEQEGFIYPVKGRGNFVADCTELLLEKRESFLEELEGRLRKGAELGICRGDILRLADRIWPPAGAETDTGIRKGEAI